MKIIKFLILEVLLLLITCIFSTVVIKIFDIILNLSHSNIGETGFKAGFIAWIILLIITLYNNVKKRGKLI